MIRAGLNMVRDEGEDMDSTGKASGVLRSQNQQFSNLALVKRKSNSMTFEIKKQVMEIRKKQKDIKKQLNQSTNAKEKKKLRNLITAYESRIREKTKKSLLFIYQDKLNSMLKQTLDLIGDQP